MERKDIRLDPDEKKEKVYEEIHTLFLQGKGVKVREHKSGFPAITVDSEDFHILTDIISLEQWWKKKKEEGEQCPERR
ncbi:hypothetical protein ES703_109071 [subsurface metagenome]